MAEVKYIFVPLKKLYEIFVMLKQRKDSGVAEDLRMVDHLLMFLSEYNVARPFWQRTRRVRQGAQTLEVELNKPIPFWPRQNGSVNRYPWQSQLKGLKIRENHWLVDEKQLQVKFGITKS